MNQSQMEELIYQALETEAGGVKIYEAALQCAENAELREEWQEYYEQTRRHHQIMQDVCAKLGLDANKETPGRKIVRKTGEALIETMNMAKQSGNSRQAQIVAAEAVVHAETKDHMNWQLIGLVCKEAEDPIAETLKDAYDQVEDQEDEHLFHTRGWARELWAEALGIKCVLPPPEEKMDVKTAMGAASAEKARRLM